MQLYATTFPSPLGQLKITCTDKEINSILFDKGEWNDAPDQQYPLLEQCMDQLTEYFAGTRIDFNLPIVQTGTPFQQKIWSLLVQIPFGKTLSYLQLSKQYGDVKAIRAIASANGRNNLPIIVPCHRVIGTNQSLTGYSGGLWRKQWLLEHEAKLHCGVQQLF